MDQHTIFQMVLTIVSPLVVFAGTWIATKIKTDIPGWITTAIIVPVLAALATAATGLLGGTDVAAWVQFLLNLLAVFVYEVQKQIGQAMQSRTAPPERQ